MTAAATVALRRRRTLLLAGGLTLAVGAAFQGGAIPVPDKATEFFGVSTAAAKTGGNGQGNSGNGNGNGGSNGGTTAPPKSFVVRGAISSTVSPDQRLAPGVQRTLTVSIQNLNNQPIKVTKLTATAAAASSSCSASLLWLGSPATQGRGSRTVSIPVPAGATVGNITFPVKLDSSVTDACQGLTWNLTYGGTAVQS